MFFARGLETKNKKSNENREVIDLERRVATDRSEIMTMDNKEKSTESSSTPTKRDADVTEPVVVKARRERLAKHNLLLIKSNEVLLKKNLNQSLHDSLYVDIN